VHKVKTAQEPYPEGTLSCRSRGDSELQVKTAQEGFLGT